MDLQVYSKSNNLYEEGGHKTHIYDWDKSRCLCGTELNGTCTLVEVTKDWLNINKGPNLCKRCENIANKLLNDDRI